MPFVKRRVVLAPFPRCGGLPEPYGHGSGTARHWNEASSTRRLSVPAAVST